MRSAAAFLALTLAAPALAQPTDLLPDIIVREADLYDNDIIPVNGRRLLRLSNGTPNIGIGKLHLYGSTINPDLTRDVVQRIFRTDGSSWDRLAGSFVYHPGHSHIHFDGWAQYRLRERPADDSVGPVVAQGTKTSFCILDLVPYDASLPGYNPAGEFRTCGSTVQGLSVGWMDIYSRSLQGQNIDITGIPDGTYWLESEVDPDNHCLESDENNNIARIKITIADGATIPPDRFEPNDTFAQVDARPVGSVNSPNLGPVGPQTVITGLSINRSAGSDYYRFYNPATGGPADFARIDFDNAKGNLSFTLYNASRVQVAASHTTNNFEQLSLNGRAPGWYYVMAKGYSRASNPDYTLTLDPAASSPPTVEVHSPPAGDSRILHGFGTYNVRWTGVDPDANPTWVTVYFNTTPTLDGNEIQIPTSLNTDGALGSHIVNSAYLEEGTYWVYCQITDGGTVTGAWSAGTVSIVEHCPADLNFDTFVDGLDSDLFTNAFDAGTQDADFNSDGFVDGIDSDLFFLAFESGC